MKKERQLVMRLKRSLIIFFLTLYATAGCISEGTIEASEVSQASNVDSTEPSWNAEKGVWILEVNSAYQYGTNTIEVLLPDAYNKQEGYDVVYILPVNPGIAGEWGDCLQVVRELDAQNQYNTIFATMSFDTRPWFGNHAADPKIRHEDYIMEVAVPLVEQHFSVKNHGESPREGRLLLGFSKSGWGAYSLLMRNPGYFGYACSWDAPLMMDETYFGLWGTDVNFGNRENMEKYLPSKLVRDSAGYLRFQKRIALLGNKFFGPLAASTDHPHTATYHELLLELGIPHTYNNSINAEHSWNSEWMAHAIKALLDLVPNP